MSPDFKSLLPARARSLAFAARTYVRRFGLAPGLAAFYKLKLSGRKRGTWKIRIPQSRTPIRLRAATSDVKAFSQIFLRGQYELPTEVSPRVIIDGGANVGCASVYFANRYPGARILAVEPVPSNFELLAENVAGYPDITPIRAALWSEPTRLAVEDPRAEPWSFSFREAGDGDEGFRAMTMEELFAAAQTEVVDVLKLDVEGAEKEIFASRPSWLEKIRTLIIEVHEFERPGSEESFTAAVRHYGFERFGSSDDDVLQFWRRRGASPE